MKYLPKALKKNNKKGFTLVELIVVLVILAILIALLVPALTGYIDKANQKKAHAEINLITKAATAAYVEVYADRKTNLLDIQYNKNHGGWKDGSKEFQNAFETLLSDDVNFDNVQSVIVTQGAGENMTLVIVYKVGEITYNYNSKRGTIIEY